VIPDVDESATTREAAEIGVVLNWTEELKRLVPPK
jgi:hypothetical protein